jgi:hypothetical protein
MDIVYNINVKSLFKFTVPRGTKRGSKCRNPNQGAARSFQAVPGSRPSLRFLRRADSAGHKAFSLALGRRVGYLQIDLDIKFYKNDCKGNKLPECDDPKSNPLVLMYNRVLNKFTGKPSDLERKNSLMGRNG